MKAYILKNFIFAGCFLFVSVCCCVGAGEGKVEADRTVATASALLASQPPTSLKDLKDRVQELQSKYHDLCERKNGIPLKNVRLLATAAIRLKALFEKYHFQPSKNPDIKLVTIQGVKDGAEGIFKEISCVLSLFNKKSVVSPKTSSLLKLEVTGRDQASLEKQEKHLSSLVTKEEESLRFFDQMYFTLKMLERVFARFSQSYIDCIDRMNRELPVFKGCSSFYMNWEDPVPELHSVFKEIDKIVKGRPKDEVLFPKPKTEEDFKSFNARKQLRSKADGDLVKILEGARIFLDVPPMSMIQVCERMDLDTKTMKNNDDLLMKLRYSLRGIEYVHLMHERFLYDAGATIASGEKEEKKKWQEIGEYTVAALAYLEAVYEKDKKQGDSK